MLGKFSLHLIAMIGTRGPIWYGIHGGGLLALHTFDEFDITVLLDRSTMIIRTGILECEVCQ